MTTRQCPYCGTEIFDQLTQCPHCREMFRPVAKHRADWAKAADGNGKIRNGLLCMLLAAVVHYFAGGYSAMQLPYPVNPIVTVYLSPLLFLSGLGLSSFGFYLKKTA
jgi:hypothetical protein